MADIDTKKQMAGGLRRLLKEKPINKVTVSEITDKCQINRQSFYYHFPDVYYLAGFLFKNDLSDILSKWLETNNWQRAFYEVFNYAIQNKEMVLNTITSVDRDILKNNVYQEIEDIIRFVIKNRTAAMNITLTPEDESKIAAFYKYPVVGYTWDWMRSGMIEDPRPAVQNIISIMVPNLDRN